MDSLKPEENMNSNDEAILQDKDKEEIAIKEKIISFFTEKISFLEVNAHGKKESIRDLKKEQYNVDVMVNTLSEDIKEYYKEKEKELNMKHSKSELVKITKPIQQPPKEVKKIEITTRSKTPVKPINKPDDRSKTPIQDKNKAQTIRTDNRTPIRERPNREFNKSPINGKSSKSPAIKSKAEAKNSLNIKVQDKKEDRNGCTKKDIPLPMLKIDKIDKKSLKLDEKSSSSDPSLELSAAPKNIELIPEDNGTLKLKLPKKVLSPEDSILMKINSVVNRSILISAKQNFYTNRELFKILTLNKEIYSIFPQSKTILINKIIIEKEVQLKGFSDVLKKYDNDSVFEGLLNKTFKPSKTAVNSLNFITKEEESILTKKEQTEEVYNVLRLLYIMLNEEYRDCPSDKLPEKLFTELFTKYKVDSIKTMIIQVVLNNLNFSKNQIDSIINLFETFPKLLNSSELLKLNKVVSYASFILKEIYEFQTTKTSEGEYLYIIKDIKKKNDDLQLKIEDLKKKIY